MAKPVPPPSRRKVRISAAQIIGRYRVLTGLFLLPTFFTGPAAKLGSRRFRNREGLRMPAITHAAISSIMRWRSGLMVLPVIGKLLRSRVANPSILRPEAGLVG
jgi:hypothetical protein